MISPATKATDPASDTLDIILSDEAIYPVYQPIVSLSSGKIYGYEALSRISDPYLGIGTEQLFQLADRMNKSWELETLCRRKALQRANLIPREKKLFLNVNPNIIYAEDFRDGCTKEHLVEYRLDAKNVIFEISERVSATDSHAFLGAIKHYKDQKFGIAIDDVGAGFSGLNTIASIRPDLIKLDMHLIRDLDKDETKQLLCKAMIDFGNNAGIRVVAEGIETEEELRTVIRLGAHFGQGYFLGIPLRRFEEILPEKVRMIESFYEKNYTEAIRSSVYPVIGNLAKPGRIFPPDKKVESIYESLRLDPTSTEFVVVENEVVIGFMTKTALSELIGGQYGYSLHAKKMIRQLLNTEFLTVNDTMPVDQVSRLAMQRPPARIYNPIVVEKDKQYLGIVTIKDLLGACTRVEIDAAIHSNPLTGLPGNLIIEKEVTRRLFSENPYCITYYDIDNFKAYNDAYGFQNGDKMLALVAAILKECAAKKEFIGHIGGDDFIVICDYHEGEEYCKAILEKFAQRVTSLYRHSDVAQGYIISKNRNGVTENFPIASLSIAGISNRVNTYHGVDEFSSDIAQLKKKCKQQPGNYYEIM